jgi:hypothetical protein
MVGGEVGYLVACVCRRKARAAAESRGRSARAGLRLAPTTVAIFGSRHEKGSTCVVVGHSDTGNG